MKHKKYSSRKTPCQARKRLPPGTPFFTPLRHAHHIAQRRTWTVGSDGKEHQPPGVKFVNNRRRILPGRASPTACLALLAVLRGQPRIVPLWLTRPLIDTGTASALARLAVPPHERVEVTVLLPGTISDNQTPNIGRLGHVSHKEGSEQPLSPLQRSHDEKGQSGAIDHKSNGDFSFVEWRGGGGRRERRAVESSLCAP